MENPKQAAGDRKPQLQLISPFAEIAEAAVLALGAKKYEPWNWRQTKINLCTYVAAIRRHLNAIMLGEDIDPESGQSHWAHIRASAGIVLDAKGVGMLNDDRPRDYEDDRPTDTGSEPPIFNCAHCLKKGVSVWHLEHCGQSVTTTTQENPGTVVKECLTTDCGETGETVRVTRGKTTTRPVYPVPENYGDFDEDINLGDNVNAPKCPHCHEPSHARGTPCPKRLEDTKQANRFNPSVPMVTCRRCNRSKPANAWCECVPEEEQRMPIDITHGPVRHNATSSNPAMVPTPPVHISQR